MSKDLVMLLAGGKGSRLHPLSRDRAKPAVPFGGRYRVIDFVLSNFTNSGFYQIKILTQFKSDSLNQHCSVGWRLARQLDQYIDLVPAQMRVGETWYLGTADAIYQNLNIILDMNPDNVFIFGGDHVYKMNVRQMLDFHKAKGADLTIAAIPIPIERATQMGVIEVDEEGQIKSFTEKPQKPKPMPGNKDMALVSMGNYIFKRDVLIKKLVKDHQDENSAHDFGHSIIPKMVGKGKVYAYDFHTNSWPGMEERERGYWCDIGTLDVYFEANMELCHRTPRMNLYSREWPIRTALHQYPPTKFVFAFDSPDELGRATNSLLAEGCVISGGQIERCVLSHRVKINSYAEMSQCVLMEGVEIGRYCKIRKAIIDKDVYVPPNTTIGYNLEHDKKRYHVTDSGIVVIPKKEKIQPD